MANALINIVLDVISSLIAAGIIALLDKLMHKKDRQG